MDNRKRKIKIVTMLFSMVLIAIAGIFVASIIKTDIYNKKVNQHTAAGEKLFTTNDDKDADVSVRIEPRSSNWSKCIDYYNKGLEGHNYQAYTYDFYIRNNTKDEIEKNKGTQFDPKIADVFLKLIKEGKI